MHRYKVYDGEELIFTGTAKEVKRKLDIRPTASLATWVTKEKSYLVRGIYRLEISDEIPIPQQPVDPHWECLHMMLVVRREDKTSIAADPSKYINRLRDCGVEVKVTPYMSIELNDTDITAPKQKRMSKKCWMVERVR